MSLPIGRPRRPMTDDETGLRELYGLADMWVGRPSRPVSWEMTLNCAGEHSLGAAKSY